MPGFPPTTVCGLNVVIMAAELNSAELNQLAETYLEDHPSFDLSLFLGAVRELVDKEDTKTILHLVETEKYKPVIEAVAWDLLPIVTPHVSNTETNHDVYQDSLLILNLIAEIGKPKELILGFLEQLDRFLDDTSYRTLLKPLVTVLMRFGLTKSYHLNQTFVLLHTHLLTCKLPSGDGLDEKQRRLLLEDPAVLRLGSNLTAVLDFLGPFVFETEQALYGSVKPLKLLELAEVNNAKTEISKFLVRVLDYPLSMMDLTWEEQTEDADCRRHKTDFRLCAEQAVTYLARLRYSFDQLLCYARDHSLPITPASGDDDVGEEDPGLGDIKGLPAKGVGCLVYLVLVEGLFDDRLPTVYSSSYLLELTSVYIAALLRKAQEDSVYKGLTLLSLLLEGIDDMLLHHSLLDNTFYEDLPQMLSVVMVMSPLHIIRQRALMVFPIFIRKFDWKGRYRLLRVLLKNTVHAGVCGMVIGMVKDYVLHSLQHHDNEWFIGQRLADLFPLIFTLPHGVETDLLELSDKVMAALNLLRFLLLRDPVSTNETSAWSHVNEIQAKFLDQLQTGLDLSMAHYQRRIALLLEDQKQKKRNKAPGPSTTLTVAGHQLPAMPPLQQMQVLRSACSTYELMQSIVGRVRDILATVQRSSAEELEVKSDDMS